MRKGSRGLLLEGKLEVTSNSLLPSFLLPPPFSSSVSSLPSQLPSPFLTRLIFQLLQVTMPSSSSYNDPNRRTSNPNSSSSSPSHSYLHMPSNPTPASPSQPYQSHTSSTLQQSWSTSTLGQAVQEAEAWRKRKVEEDRSVEEASYPQKDKSRRSSADLPAPAKTVASCKECRRLSEFSFSCFPSRRKEREEGGERGRADCPGLGTSELTRIRLSLAMCRDQMRPNLPVQPLHETRSSIVSLLLEGLKTREGNG